MTRMKSFAVLIEPWAVYVKDWDFFVSQGGETAEWGKSWCKMQAKDLDDARRKGQALGEKKGICTKPRGRYVTYG